MKKLRFAILSFVTLFALSMVPTTAQAQGFFNFFGGGGGSSSNGDCGETKTHLVSCDGKTGVAAIGDLIRIATGVMSVLIGVVATGAIAYAAALYASARDDQERVASAIRIIRMVVIGLLMYVFTLAIINWLIPGSVIEAPPPSESTSPSPSVSSTPPPTQ